MTRRSLRPLRIVLIGWGAINKRVAKLLQSDLARGDVVIVGIGLRPSSRVQDIPPGTVVVAKPSELGALSPDLVVEAAGRDAVADWGDDALRAAPIFVVASASALTDDKLFRRLEATAEASGSRIVVPPGALAGVDALAAASALPLEEVLHSIAKPPAAWRGTPAEKLLPLDGLTAAVTFFTGTARQAASSFPQNANVAAITALAGIGLDRTSVELVADPTLSRNCHRLMARGDFGLMTVTIENNPLAGNPKSSEMAALSLVRLIGCCSRRVAI